MDAAQSITPSDMPAGQRPYFYGSISVAVRHNGMIYTCGLVGVDLKTGEPVSQTDVAAQVHRTLQNLRQVLEEAGSSLDKVLTATCWLSDLANWREYDAIWATHFTRDPKPARATVRAELVQPWLFEMQATAYI